MKYLKYTVQLGWRHKTVFLCFAKCNCIVCWDVFINLRKLRPVIYGADGHVFHSCYRVKPALLLRGTHTNSRRDVHQLHQGSQTSLFQHAINHHKSGCHSCWSPLPLRSCSTCFQGWTCRLPPWRHKLRGPHPVLNRADKCVTTTVHSLKALWKSLLSFMNLGKKNVFHWQTLNQHWWDEIIFVVSTKTCISPSQTHTKDSQQKSGYSCLSSRRDR